MSVDRDNNTPAFYDKPEARGKMNKIIQLSSNTPIGTIGSKITSTIVQITDGVYEFPYTDNTAIACIKVDGFSEASLVYGGTTILERLDYLTGVDMFMIGRHETGISQMLPLTRNLSVHVTTMVPNQRVCLTYDTYNYSKPSDCYFTPVLTITAHRVCIRKNSISTVVDIDYNYPTECFKIYDIYKSLSSFTLRIMSSGKDYRDMVGNYGITPPDLEHDPEHEQNSWTMVCGDMYNDINLSAVYSKTTLLTHNTHPVDRYISIVQYHKQILNISHGITPRFQS